MRSEAALAAASDNVAVLLPYGADSVAAGFYRLGEAVDRSDKILALETAGDDGDLGQSHHDPS